MGFRTVYGNDWSENGWRMCDAAECDWMSVPGTDVTLQIRRGAPAVILTRFAQRFNATVEPLRDPDSACWTPTNDVPTSNHLSGTGMDLNWNSHPFHAVGTFGDRLPALRALLDEFDGGVWWGGDWDEPKDEMHFQLNWPEGDPRNDALAAKLGGAPPPPRSRVDEYAILIIAEGQRRNVSPRGIQIALATALVESNLTNYANSNDPASLELPHDAVGSDGMSVGVFQQQNFPEWGPLECRMDVACSAGTFYEHLARLDYNNIHNSPGSYAQAVQRSAFPDRYDQRFGEAVDLYNRLATIPPIEGPFMALSDEEQRELLEKTRDNWDANYERVPSQSEYGDPNILWYRKDFPWNDDLFLYDMWTERCAALGDDEALERIKKAAAKGSKIAANWLAQFSGTAPLAPQPTLTPTPNPTPTPTSPPSPQPTPPSDGQGSLSAAINQFGAQMAQANSDFAQRMQEFKTMLNQLIG